MSEYIEEPDTIRNELIDNGVLSGGRISDNLRECPFCGSNKVYPNQELSKHWIECRECTAESGNYRTEAKAIAAWNTRAERTCHAVGMDCFGNPPYNQSGLSGNSTAIGCSECGAPWSTCGLFRGNYFKHNFNACPICGAKITEAD